MANWSLKVSVGENALDLRRQVGILKVWRNVDSDPRCSSVTLTASPTSSHSHHPQATLPFVVLRTAIQLRQHLGVCPFCHWEFCPLFQRTYSSRRCFSTKSNPTTDIFQPWTPEKLLWREIDLKSPCVWVLGCFRHIRKHSTNRKLSFSCWFNALTALFK